MEHLGNVGLELGKVLVGNEHQRTQLVEDHDLRVEAAVVDVEQLHCSLAGAVDAHLTDPTRVAASATTTQ